MLYICFVLGVVCETLPVGSTYSESSRSPLCWQNILKIHYDDDH